MLCWAVHVSWVGSWFWAQGCICQGAGETTWVGGCWGASGWLAGFEGGPEGWVECGGFGGHGPPSLWSAPHRMSVVN